MWLETVLLLLKLYFCHCLHSVIYFQNMFFSERNIIFFLCFCLLYLNFVSARKIYMIVCWSHEDEVESLLRLVYIYLFIQNLSYCKHNITFVSQRGKAGSGEVSKQERDTSENNTDLLTYSGVLFWSESSDACDNFLCGNGKAKKVSENFNNLFHHHARLCVKEFHPSLHVGERIASSSSSSSMDTNLHVIKSSVSSAKGWG